jgi:hypothetical protein
MLLLLVCAGVLPAQTIRMSYSEYEDRVRAAWTGQILGTLIGFQFEHKAAATAWVDKLPDKYKSAPADDDYYYEVVALRAFEKHGTALTVEQLGELWKKHNIGAWGSSEQARLLMAKGIKPPMTGHPRYNRLWFTIGTQFSSDIYGMVTPGMPNVAGRIARELGHINGFAEGSDGGVFVAGMVSLAFVEKDPRQIVKKASQLIHPESPYRQCIDLVVALAEKGATARQVADAVEDRWHIEYPATNNAVANGGLIAVGVWFGEGDFLQTVNHVFQAADYTDADCNAANAAAVVGALKGMKAFPASMVEQLHDKMDGSEMGGVKFDAAVNESLLDIAKRTAAVGAKFVEDDGGKRESDTLIIRSQQPSTMPAETFQLSRLTEYWNAGWKLMRAGFGGAGGGMRGLRGNTYLDGEVLATYPRDEVRGTRLERTLKLGQPARLQLDAGADAGRAWQLDVHVDNALVHSRVIAGKAQRTWEHIDIDLAPFANRQVTVRLIQRVLLAPEKAPGNAYWRNVQIE